MNTYAIYDVSTGLIKRVYLGSESEALIQPKSGEDLVQLPQDSDGSDFYILAGEPTPRQPFGLQINKLKIVADAEDSAIISGIPEGTTVIWHDGLEEVVTDGVVELATDLSGRYKLRFKAVPYLYEEVIIEAHPAT